jgi:SAM-dependent methyltransferase
VGSAGWRGYLGGFHAERPGITEEILARATDGRSDPYGWVVGRLRPSDRVLDLGCGSAPMAPLRPGPWVGIDLSAAELERARRRGAGPLAVADATALPFVSGAFDAVVCSMGLMVIQPLDAALAEIARVLRPGGRVVALLPARKPLQPADALLYGQLVLALRSPLRFPNDDDLADPTAVLAGAGLSPVLDEYRRFQHPVDDPAAAARFVRSLYVPHSSPERLERAAAVARRWVGHSIGVPLRLLVAER